MVLFSGSLASALAVRLAQRAGLRDLQLVFFRSPFFRNEEGVVRSAQMLKLPLRTVTVKREFLRLPSREGDDFPCGACRRALLERAARLLRRRADLVVTGEMVGQAGLTPPALQRLEGEVGLAGRVLRPLSAKLLPPTRAEAEGAVDRQALLGLSHLDLPKSRVGELARDFGLPLKLAGRACLLSDPVFAQRCREFWRAGNLAFTANFVELLEFPHLFRLSHGALLVVAAAPREQARLQDLFLPEDVRIYLPRPGSPLGLVRGPWVRLSPEAREHVIQLAAQKLLGMSGLAPDGIVCYRLEEAEETCRLRLSPGALRGGFSPVN